MELKMAYDDFSEASDQTGLLCRDKSLAVQSGVVEADINTIVKRFGLTGQLPTDLKVPRFEDFEVTWDFHSAMNLVAEARDAFMKMPAHVRARFQNDPGAFVAFVSDERNTEEARKLGILIPAQLPELPIEVRVMSTEVAPAPGDAV